MKHSSVITKNYMRSIVCLMLSFFIGTAILLKTESAWGAIPTPVLALSFDEGAGTVVNDASGTGNNGSVIGATWTTSGKYGGALDFNGTSSRVAIPDSNSLDLTNGMTIELWVYPTATPAGWQSVVTKEVPGDGVYSLYANTTINNRPYVGLNIGGAPQSLSGVAQLTPNTWTHLATTYNGSTLTLYVNGVQVGSKAVTGSITTSTNGLSIGGAQFSSEFFKGRIDNIRIYNQALAAADIVTLRDTPVSSGPQLVINQPTNGSLISASALNITYSIANSPTGVDHAVFQLDGNPSVSDPTLDGAYQFASVTFGVHTISGYLAKADNTKIAASDAAPVSFTLTDPSDSSAPTVNFTLPVDGSVVSGATTLQATGIDNIGVVGMQFYLDGGTLGNEITGSGATTSFQMSWDTTGTSSGSHILKARARDLAGNQTMSTSVTVTVANGSNPATLGLWSPVMDWPLVAVHTTLLPTGEVLTWDAWEDQSQAVVWNPATQGFLSVPSLYGLFCSVHTLMPAGRVLVTGGHDPALPNGEWGIRQTNIFDPFTKSWISAKGMNNPRWYPGGQRLADGRYVAISGSMLATTYANNPEIYNPANNTWTTMSSVSTSGITTSNEYPRTFLLPDGRVFIGADENGPVKVLNVATNTLASLPNGPNLHYSAAQFRPGKILISGGGSGNVGSATTTTASVKTAYVIDMNLASPTFRAVASMANGRFQHNLTVLADGTVFGVGGSNRMSLQSSTGPLTPEIWNPTTENWTAVAAMQNNRNYHSTSLLMPDGRVLVAGGGRLGVSTNFTTAEMYSPPYLFKGTRPTISSAPATANLGATMVVQTPNAASIANVAMVPLASVTHTMDWNQNYIPLTFTAGAGQLQISMPTNANIGIPGYYMLFILNTQGVPAVAPIFQFLGAATDNVLPTATGNLQANAGTTSAALSWTAATDNVGVVLYNVHRSTTSGFTPATANRIAQIVGTTYTDSALAVGTYYYKVTAQDAANNVGPASGQATAVIASDTTLPSAPGTLSATGSQGSALLNWGAATDNIGVVLYNVYRSTTSGFTASTANRIAQIAGTTYTNTGLAAGTYYFLVTAQDANNNVGPASNQATAVVTAVVDNIAPTVPTNLQAAAASTSAINLTWTASTDTGGSGMAGYRVYRGLAANSLVQIGPALVTTPSYADSGLTANTTYYYAVAAVDAANNASNQTAAVNAKTQSTSTTSQLGTTAVGTVSDSGYANTMSAYRYQTGAAQSGPVSSMSVYIPAPISGAPNNLFQVAIYSDAGGNPGALIASSVSQTISATGWNTVPIAASLSANTAYWLVYNTNGTGTANNSLILTPGGTYSWHLQTFGTWPATFGAPQGTAPYSASMYATVN